MKKNNSINKQILRIQNIGYTSQEDVYKVFLNPSYINTSNILRDAFIKKNNGWIELLNHTKDILLVKKIEFQWVTIEGKEIRKSTLELDFLSSSLEKWQYENNLQDKNNLCMFQTEREMLFECMGFMWVNLRAISRGEHCELRNVGKITIQIAEKIIQYRGFFLSTKGIFTQDVFNEGDETILFSLSKYLYSFCEYIKEAIEGLKNKAKLGFFKVGICPYKKIKDTLECGRVFVGRQYNQVACEEHCRKYQLLKANHKNRLNKKKATLKK